MNESVQTVGVAQSAPVNGAPLWTAEAYTRQDAPDAIGLRVSNQADRAKVWAADNPRFAVQLSNLVGVKPVLESMHIDHDTLTVKIVFSGRSPNDPSEAYTSEFALTPSAVVLRSQTVEQKRPAENMRALSSRNYVKGAVTHQRFALDSGKPLGPETSQLLLPPRSIELTEMGDLLSFSPKVKQQTLY